MPVSHGGCAGGVLQRLHIKHLLGIFAVGGEFAHLESLSFVGVFISHCQHLVRLQRLFQGHIAQCCIQGIFRTVELSGRLQFFVVHTSHEPGSVKRLRGRGDVACIRQAVVQLTVKGIRVVVGIFLAGGHP